MSTLSNRLNFLIKEKGIKPAILAEKANVNKSTISRILSGVAIPNAETLYKIANYLGVSVEYLMTGKEGCASATYTIEELELIEGFRSLSSKSREEILSFIKFKLTSEVVIKGDDNTLAKSTISTTTDGEDPREKMA